MSMISQPALHACTLIDHVVAQACQQVCMQLLLLPREHKGMQGSIRQRRRGSRHMQQLRHTASCHLLPQQQAPGHYTLL